ncbi:aspartic peptidase domain-containing protein, partial [Paraphoma chrysanthemicola]
APFSFSPSELWDGNNGNWSSFVIRVGTPEQHFRVLPSAATGAVFVPGSTGCLQSEGDPHDCADRRGVINSTFHQGFESNASETWKTVGSFETLIATELGYAANASFGSDYVGLKGSNSGAPRLADQVVGSLFLKQPFFVGFFGLSPKPFNFTDFNDPRPSYITSLRSTGGIPSVSYGYTAGASYSNTGQILGSLTLGGYDENRFESHSIKFPFGPNDERPTSLTLQHMTADSTPNGTVTLLQNRIYVNLDFTTPYLWLPANTCDRIASQFNLKYDAATTLYIVGNDSHAELVASNPSFTFDLGDSQNPADRVSIVVSYAAFDLQASWPTYNSSTKYFPIRRADESQYTLGRAFMQEAYIIVDYERKNFSVHKALFPATREQKLTSILAEDVDQNAKSYEKETHLSRASFVGITIGSIVCLVVLVAATVLFYCRRRRSCGADQANCTYQSS